MAITFLRKRHLAGRDGMLGISVSTLDRMVRDQKFPAPTCLGARAVGWPSHVVELWQATRTVKGGTQ